MSQEGTRRLRKNDLVFATAMVLVLTPESCCYPLLQYHCDLCYLLCPFSQSGISATPDSYVTSFLADATLSGALHTGLGGVHAMNMFFLSADMLFGMGYCAWIGYAL